MAQTIDQIIQRLIDRAKAAGHPLSEQDIAHTRALLTFAFEARDQGVARREAKRAEMEKQIKVLIDQMAARSAQHLGGILSTSWRGGSGCNYGFVRPH